MKMSAYCLSSLVWRLYLVLALSKTILGHHIFEIYPCDNSRDKDEQLKDFLPFWLKILFGQATPLLYTDCLFNYIIIVKIKIQ